MRRQARLRRTSALACLQRAAASPRGPAEPAVHRRARDAKNSRGLGLRHTSLHCCHHAQAQSFLRFGRQGTRICLAHASRLTEAGLKSHLFYAPISNSSRSGVIVDEIASEPVPTDEPFPSADILKG